MKNKINRQPKKEERILTLTDNGFRYLPMDGGTKVMVDQFNQHQLKLKELAKERRRQNKMECMKFRIYSHLNRKGLLSDPVRWAIDEVNL